MVGGSTRARTLVLASASPRRSALLNAMGLRFEVAPGQVDESVRAGESPRAYVERLARHKARAGHRAGAITLGADTCVVLDDEILGKPSDEQACVEMLARLSGRQHQVLTGVAAYDGDRLESQVVGARVTFRDISVLEATAYWASGEPADKAGGYGIQGIGGIFAERIEGSYSAVVGLPVAETEALLCRLGLDTWSMRTDG